MARENQTQNHDDDINIVTVNADDIRNMKMLIKQRRRERNPLDDGRPPRRFWRGKDTLSVPYVRNQLPRDRRWIARACYWTPPEGVQTYMKRLNDNKDAA